MELIVKGMTCGHCEAAVQRAVKAVAPQAEVVIDRIYDRVSITGDADAGRVARAILAFVDVVGGVSIMPGRFAHAAPLLRRIGPADRGNHGIASQPVFLQKSEAVAVAGRQRLLEDARGTSLVKGQPPAIRMRADLTAPGTIQIEPCCLRAGHPKQFAKLVSRKAQMA